MRKSAMEMFSIVAIVSWASFTMGQGELQQKPRGMRNVGGSGGPMSAPQLGSWGGGGPEGGPGGGPGGDNGPGGGPGGGAPWGGNSGPGGGPGGGGPGGGASWGGNGGPGGGPGGGAPWGGNGGPGGGPGGGGPGGDASWGGNGSPGGNSGGDNGPGGGPGGGVPWGVNSGPGGGGPGGIAPWGGNGGPGGGPGGDSGGDNGPGGGPDYSADYDPNSYPDYGETTVNDAANFNKRQHEMATPPTPVGAPAAPPLPPKKKGGGGAGGGGGNGGGGANGGKRRGKAGRKGGAARRQQRPRQLNLRNPLGPKLRVAVAQAQFQQRRPQRKRKQDPDLVPAMGNFTAANNTNTGDGGGGNKRKKPKKNGRPIRKRNQKGRKNNRKKGKNNKKNKAKPAAVTTPAASQFEYQKPQATRGRRPGANVGPTWAPMATPTTEDDYYYEYYDELSTRAPETASGGSGRWPSSGGRPPSDPNAPSGPGGWGNQPPSGGAWGPPGGQTMMWSTMGPAGPPSEQMGPGPPGPPSASSSNFCQSQNFNDATYCCSLSQAIFFDPDDMDECLQDLDNDEEPSSVEDYSLSRGVIGKGEIDFNAPAMQNLTDAICLTQCTMLSLELLGSSPGTLLFESINSYIISNLNENNQTEWLPAINAASKNCEKFLTEKMGSISERVETPDASCYTKPYLYIQCIKQYALQDCPKPSDRMSSDFCKESMGNMVTCNPFD